MGAEALAVDRAIEDAGCCDPVKAQRAEEGQGPPPSLRGEAAEALALRRPAAQGNHVRLDPGLVDEDQAFRIEPGLQGLPAPPTPATSARACSRANSVFLKLSPSRRRNVHTGLCETAMPRAASSSLSLCKVRCDVWSIRLRKARWASSTGLRCPPTFSPAPPIPSPGSAATTSPPWTSLHQTAPTGTGSSRRHRPPQPHAHAGHSKEA